MAVPIKKWLDKIPGGIIIVPLFLGCLINTFFPAALQIGSFTTGIVNGTSALVGIFFVCMGAQLDLKCAPQAMKTGFAITCEVCGDRSHRSRRCPFFPRQYVRPQRFGYYCLQLPTPMAPYSGL